MQLAYSTAKGRPREVRRAQFLGIDFHVGTQPEVLQEIEARLRWSTDQSTVIAHANLHSTYTSSSFDRMRNVLERRATLVLFEGIALKLARFATAGQWWPDFSGTDLVPLFLSAPRARRLTIALVGGSPDVVESAARFVEREHPTVEVVAVVNGFGDIEVGSDAHCRVAATKPDVVLLGLGSPLQEVAGASWAKAGTAPLIWCVGGLFDFWADRRIRAPAWIRAARLEWLWRLAGDPCRLWRRTFVEGPWLLGEVVAQWRRG